MRELQPNYTIYGNGAAEDEVLSQDVESPTYDDLLMLDSNLLLNPTSEYDERTTDRSSPTSEELSPFLNDLELESEFFCGNGLGNDVFSMDLNDYSPTHSTDSGKHSPSESDSSSDHASPWVYPAEPSTSQFNPIDVSSNLQYSNASFPSHNRVPFNQSFNNGFTYDSPAHNIQNMPLSHVSHSNSPRKKIIYLVKPNKQVNGFCPNSPKLEPPPTPQPIYINKNTGMQVKPIPALVKPTHVPPTVVTYVSKEDSMEEYRKKQEVRKMRNRASAQASRLKKMQEIDHIRKHVVDLENENKMLRNENEQLKERLSRYEGPSSNKWASPPRKRIALAGVFMLSIFAFCSLPSPGIERSNSSVKQSLSYTKTHVYHGKVLSLEESLPTKPSNQSVSCGFKKNWLNQTETIRLNTDLYDWVDRHEQIDLQKMVGRRVLLGNTQKTWLANNKMERVNVTDDSSVKPTKTEKQRNELREKAMRKRAWNHIDMLSQAETLRERRERTRQLAKEEKLLSKNSTLSKEQYEKLATTIQQRTDTLYVVTMKDYFLLPAIKRNATSSPRISIILPALSANGTLDSQVPMMRIDLDVVGTGLFFLSKEFIPLF